MKTRIFGIFICAMLVVSFFAGCNLFSTHNETYYNQIVAEAHVGDTKIEISKEQLLNSYYNYGSQLLQQGMTVRESLEECVDQLINRELMLKYVKAEAASEVLGGAEEKDYQWELTNAEYNQAVKDTWTYLNDQLSSYAKELYGSAGEFVSEEEKTPDFAAQTEYVPTVEFDGAEGIFKKYVDPDFVFETEEKLNANDYSPKEFANQEQTDAVYNKLIENLKVSQKERGQKPVGNDATLQREIDRAFKVNLENAYLNKFQTVFTNGYGFDKDGKLTEQTELKVLNKYKEKYAANKEEADIAPANFGNNVVASGGLGNYVYYGSGETFFNVVHILVQFSEAQKSAVSVIDSDIYLTDDEKAALKAEYNSVENTKVYLRDEDGFKTQNSVSVEDLNTILQNLYEEVRTQQPDGDTTTDKFAKEMAERFNDLIYVYGEDTGMINPTFDYVLGTTSSGMVESFTEESRNLHSLGQRGAISSWVESTHGYHFIMYLGEIKPIVLNPNEITLELLNRSQRLSGGTTYLESLLSEVAQADFSGYQQRLLSGLAGGIKITLYEGRYKDLLG